MAGIYIHIPFCKQACSYCDFYFSIRQNLREPFVDALVREIESYAGTHYTEELFTTLYIGGGTPSLLNSSQIGRIFKGIRDTFHTDFEEITMELNPDDVTPGYLNMLLDAGVNRASMGIQSFNEEILTFMHRAHSKEEAIQALEALSATGFPAFTADLIYGNPGQTTDSLEQDIRQLLAFNPPHISAYSLTVEPKTRLGKQVELGRIKPPDDGQVSEHFDLVHNLLKSHGIYQYEVSNYAVPGSEAIHNSNYWTHRNYLGLGPAAHSFWWDDQGARRWNNNPDLKSYLFSDHQLFENVDHLDEKTLAEERLMLGLRTRNGISIPDFQAKYHYFFNSEQKQWISHQEKLGMAVKDSSSIRFTFEGIKISDLLVVDLLSKQ